MSSMTPSPSIRPSRGLWAAVSPHGEVIPVVAIGAEESLAAEAMLPNTKGGWNALAARGWRIIRVDVIPHEESD